MPEMVKLVDRELRQAFDRMAKQIEGKRSWPVTKKMVDYKRGHLDDPWKQKGIDEEGRGRQWAPNAERWTQRKLREKMGIRRRLADISLEDRMRFLMVYTGALREAIETRFVKKKKVFEIYAKGISGYPYMLLYGKPGIYPPRPWGVWTNGDLEHLKSLLENWGANFGAATRIAA